MTQTLGKTDYVQGVTGDVHQPAANTAAVVTYAANATQRHVLDAIEFSIDTAAAAAATKLTVEDGSGNVIFATRVGTALGRQRIVFDPPKAGTVNTAMIVTVSAPGGTSVAALSCDHRILP